MEEVKYVLLSGLGASIFPEAERLIKIKGVKPEEMKNELAGKIVESYIGHPATKEVVSKLLQDTAKVVDKGREEFHLPEIGKVVMFVVALPRRNQSPSGDVQVQSINELIIRRVEVL